MISKNLKDKKLLVIANVWPESTSSAAGRRMVQLLEVFHLCGMQIFVGSTAKKGPYSGSLECFNVQEVPLWLNDSRTNSIIENLQPDVVLYDRFMMEEQFGWIVDQVAPLAMTLLDTEDLHFLREARTQMYKKSEGDLGNFLYNEKTKRELASMLRCDVSIIISKVEYEMLVDKFSFPAQLLYVLPFLEKKITEQRKNILPCFDVRQNFVFIGNFIHEPNYQTVLKLKKEIWPKLSKLLPKAKMLVFGAYASAKVEQLHNEGQRFHIMGRAKDAQQEIAKCKVMLAPIPFGAGIKGKFIDAMQSGTPNVSSSIGSESMIDDNANWPGFISDDVEEFVKYCESLYLQKDLWEEKQKLGWALLDESFDFDKPASAFILFLSSIFLDLEKHRQRNFLAQVFKHQCAASTKYMSMWIAQKNKHI